MARRKGIPVGELPSIADPSQFTPPAEPALKKQSRWSTRPWEPGEIPAGGFREVHSGPQYRTPYGEALGVCPPENRGTMKSKY